MGSNGGSFYDDKWNPQFTKGAFLGALEYLKTMADAKVLPPDWLAQSGLGMFTEFGSGITAMIDHGYGRIAGYIDRYSPDKASEEYFRTVWRPVVPGEDVVHRPGLRAVGRLRQVEEPGPGKEWLKLFFTQGDVPQLRGPVPGPHVPRA